MESELLKEIKKAGGKMTKVRTEMALLFSECKPLTVDDIKSYLTRKGIRAHKTTVYREIEYLKKLALISQINLGKRGLFYELSADHHHHLVCSWCGGIEQVKNGSAEKMIHNLQEELEKHSGFVKINHSLEFFGVCHSCSKTESRL